MGVSIDLEWHIRFKMKRDEKRSRKVDLKKLNLLVGALWSTQSLRMGERDLCFQAFIEMCWLLIQVHRRCLKSQVIVVEFGCFETKHSTSDSQHTKVVLAFPNVCPRESWSKFPFFICFWWHCFGKSKKLFPRFSTLEPFRRANICFKHFEEWNRERRWLVVRAGVIFAIAHNPLLYFSKELE